MKKQNKDNLKNIVKLFFEFGHLKRVQHVGWTVAGVKDPENVAEHTARAAQIGYILAKLENVDADKVMLMCLFHDLGEARVNDAHRIETRYHNYYALKEAEMRAFLDQVSPLPENIKNELVQAVSKFEAKETPEGECAKDADYLDQAVSAKEYLDIGYKGCQDWLDNIKKALKTETAKKLMKIIEATDRNEWWDNLKRLDEVLGKNKKEAN